METQKVSSIEKYRQTAQARLDQFKKDAKEDAKKAAEAKEQELLAIAQKEFDDAIHKLEEIIGLLDSTCAIKAPISKIKTSFGVLGKKYRPESPTQDDKSGGGK